MCLKIPMGRHLLGGLFVFPFGQSAKNISGIYGANGRYPLRLCPHYKI
jgi:hypothetical protein